MLQRFGRTVILCGCLIGVGSTTRAQDQFEAPPIEYSSDATHNAVARLAAQLESLEASQSHRELLESVLKQLDVPVSSQTLVFSKTSLQRDRISPQTPRAIYFNDDVYVGWVPGSVLLELSAVDPDKGAIFYTLAKRKSEPPRLKRQTHECLQCHASSLTEGAPGHLVRSVYADDAGFPILSKGSFITDDRSPLPERWGGWYVTGTHGAQRHMGNIFYSDDEQKPDFARGANVTELAGQFDVENYLSPHSDLVALLVLEHQTRMHNLITRTNHDVRFAIRDRDVLNEMRKEPAGTRVDSIDQRIARSADRLVQALLFSKSAEFTGPVAGTSTFAAEFAARGPFDAEQRSLRQFDLERRVFRYPCSYLIYSEAFGELPVEVKRPIYDRLLAVLTADDPGPEYRHLSAEDRRAIREILAATKDDLPSAWRIAN